MSTNDCAMPVRTRSRQPLVPRLNIQLPRGSDIPSTSSLMEPKDVRRRLLDLERPGVSQEEGDESRECSSPQGPVVNRGMVGVRCEGAEEVTEAMVRERALYKGPPGGKIFLVGKYLGVEWAHGKRKKQIAAKIERVRESFPGFHRAKRVCRSII